MTRGKAELNELIDTWWRTAEAMEARPGCSEARTNWHAHVFDGILKACGWTTLEWNDALDEIKAKEKPKAEE